MLYAHCGSGVAWVIYNCYGDCDHVSCSVLQCTAVCCSVLQCVAVCCSALHTNASSKRHGHKESSTFLESLNSLSAHLSRTQWVIYMSRTQRVIYISLTQRVIYISTTQRVIHTLWARVYMSRTQRVIYLHVLKETPTFLQLNESYTHYELEPSDSAHTHLSRTQRVIYISTTQ